MSNMGLQEIKFLRREQKALDFRKIPALARHKIAHAELPSLYQAAQLALRECNRIDEVKDVKDRHDAIALYAKQAKDTTLLYYAERIKLRAIERIGELLKELPDKDARNRAAKEGGLALSVARRSEEIANIPKRVRDQMIESTPPPSYTKMAQQGVRAYGDQLYNSGFHYYSKRESLYTPTHASCGQELADAICETVKQWQAILLQSNGLSFRLKDVVRAIPSEEAPFLREKIAEIFSFLDEVDQYLPQGEK